MKILIVRLSALGDVLHCLPSLQAIRREFPHATIDWVVESSSADVLSSIKSINELIVLPRSDWQRRAKKLDGKVLAEAVSFFRALRGRRYDVAIDFQGNFRSGLVTYLSGAPIRIGFCRRFSRELNTLFTNRRVTPIPSARHKVERDLQLLKALGIANARPNAELPANEAAAARVQAFLAGLPPKRKLVLFHPGASRFGAFKRWPRQNYAELGIELASKANANIVVTWGPGEEELARSVADGIGDSARPAPPTALADLVELIRRADLFISSDTGPMNIAPLVGTPTVTLFGPKDPAVYAPFSADGRVVVKDIPCRPCGLRKCAVTWCMKWITPLEIARPALEILNG